MAGTYFFRNSGRTLQQAAIAGGEPLPGWYSEPLFKMDMNSFGTLLRQYFQATASERCR